MEDGNRLVALENPIVRSTYYLLQLTKIYYILQLCSIYRLRNWGSIKIIRKGTQLANRAVGIPALLPSEVWNLSIGHSGECVKHFPETFSLNIVLKIFCVELDEFLAIQNVWLFGMTCSFQKGTRKLRFLFSHNFSMQTIQSEPSFIKIVNTCWLTLDD